MTIITAFLIVAPFTAIVSLMGFNKIKQKVEQAEFKTESIKGKGPHHDDTEKIE